MKKFFYIISMLVYVAHASLAIALPFEKAHQPVEVQLLSAQSALGDQKIVKAGLEFKLKSGWKIYAPSLETKSTFSAAPQVTWEGSTNVKNFNILWPKSKNYTLEGFNYQAYEGDVILPLHIEVIDPQKPMTLNLTLNYNVCSTTCVPLQDSLTLTLQPGLSKRTSDAALIEIFEKKVKVPSHDAALSYEWMLLFAFIGGFILNFMPCVLPVLSLKIISFAKGNRPSQSGKESLGFRSRFMATFLGIMISFLILGGLAVGLDYMGIAVGWGSHFQQPSFLVFLILITTLFSNSLWGFLDIELPYFVRNGLGKLLSYEHEHHNILIEDFTAGMLATLLATPCTAPFLGTALGYAFAQSGLQIILFFMVMGLGFSMPYWLGALLPQGWIKVPKPGNWMIILSKTLGWLLALTTVWLLWVLSESFKSSILILLAIGVIAMSLIFKASQRHPHLKKINWLIAGLMMLTPLVQPTAFNHNTVKSSTSSSWQTFAPDTISQLVDQGHTVVVDITAAWCLTCQLNKYMVLESQKGIKLLAQPKVIKMRADWTHRNAEITQYLARYHRGGIPFNIVFGPAAPQGIILPEILTFKALKDALQQANMR
ncbi:MAG: protein-disulfide reductase DsbD family protein [Janthinobacterium lividum]